MARGVFIDGVQNPARIGVDDHGRKGRRVALTGGMAGVSRVVRMVDAMSRLRPIHSGETTCQGDHRDRRRQPVTPTAQITHVNTQT